MTARAGVVVAGQIGRDLVLRTIELPEQGTSTELAEWRELLGGKGANQAVGLRQLGADVALLGVVGDDVEGDAVLDQAAADGIDISYVARRGRTALLIDVVDEHGDRLLLEGVPDDATLRQGDVDAAADLCRAADTVVLQLQQPADVLLRLARLARDSRARVVLDGGAEGEDRDALLAVADVVRADAVEACMLAGQQVAGRRGAARAAEQLLAAGPSVVALAVEQEGDLVAWRGGQAFFPHGDAPVRDTTGAGDAFVAGLVTGLRRGCDPETAGGLAAAAAAATVTRVGGRPDLTPLRAQVGAR